MITYRKLGKFGRWGNQLFQYAGAWLYAMHFGYHGAFPHWDGCKVFKNIPYYSYRDYLLSRFLPTRQLDDVRAHPRWKPTRLWALQELYERGDDNINLYGYLQDPLSIDFLQRYKPEILKLYTFIDEIEETYKKAVTSFEPYLVLHLRRGDFVKLGYALPSAFYKKLLPKIHGGRRLYITSDDPTINEEFENIETFKLANPLPYIPRFIFEFWMIKNAETVNGCGSTFSWWAAYLGNKNDYWSPPLTHLWPKNTKPAIEKIEI